MGDKRTVGAAAAGGPFQPYPSPYFIDPAEQFDNHSTGFQQR